MITVNAQVISKAAPLLEYLKKQRENERLMKTVEIGTTFVFISFFAFFAIKPAVTTISSLIGEIKSKEILTKAMKTKISQVIQAQEKFALIQEKYQIVNASLPDDPRYTHSLIQVLGSAQTGPSTINRVNFYLPDDSAKASKTPEITNKNLKQYGLIFDGVSTFKGGVTLVSQIQNNRRLFSINNLTIAPKKDPQGKEIIDTSQLNFKYDITTYYWDQQQSK